MSSIPPLTAVLDWTTLEGMATSFYGQSLALWAWVGGFVYVLLMVVAMVHALLNKKNIRAAIGWIGLIWFAPVIGLVLYWLFGINRIQRRARSRLEDHEHPPPPATATGSTGAVDEDPAGRPEGKFRSLASLTRKITRLPLLGGNTVDPLLDTDEAFDRMLAAIRGAEESITLCTYIFSGSGIGEKFVEALKEAHRSGVDVRVIVDDVGARYSSPSVTRRLRNAEVPTARFMRTWLPWKFRYFNLRNHRKIMVVDGRKGFTGGLNISKQFSRHDVDTPGLDVHFRLEGPVVSHLQYTFADDWLFCRGEELTDERWFPPLSGEGSVLARGIADGPDLERDRIRNCLLGALSAAEESIRIVSPYFLPDDELLSALCIASMKDVEVDVITPRVNNPRMVQWASMTGQEELAEHDCNLYWSNPPFDHSKLMTVDDAWTFFGSANWDARSLKLNFEFNVEAYDRNLTRSINERIEKQKEHSKTVEVSDFRNRSLPAKIRDNAFRLFSPYL